MDPDKKMKVVTVEDCRRCPLGIVCTYSDMFEVNPNMVSVVIRGGCLGDSYTPKGEEEKQTTPLPLRTPACLSHRIRPIRLTTWPLGPGFAITINFQ